MVNGSTFNMLTFSCICNQESKRSTMIFKMLPIYIVLSFLLFFSYIGEAKENENRAGKICEYILYREEKNQFSGFT